MITDRQTNFLYLADTLPLKFPHFYKSLCDILDINGVVHSLLPDTKDIWAVDYMPIQVNDNKFVQFIYNPDYLKTKKWEKTISDTTAICQAINVSTQIAGIILDGGNVVKSDKSVIMCDKIFRENSDIPERTLIKNLLACFEVERVIFIPQDPNDFTGHADGMVRFIDEHTVLINDLSNESSQYRSAFRMSLHNAGLEYVELPYVLDVNKNDSAIGLYLNYLEMDKLILLPVFGKKEDEWAFKKLQSIFPQKKICTLDSSSIAVEGGVLNCITWNIKTQ